jgi:hypothetical protein
MENSFSTRQVRRRDFDGGSKNPEFSRLISKLSFCVADFHSISKLFPVFNVNKFRYQYTYSTDLTPKSITLYRRRNLDHSQNQQS